MIATTVVRVMPFTYEDKIIIKHYRLEYKLGRKQILRRFRHKDWSPGGLDYLLRKIDETGTIERSKGSGRKRTQRTEENMAKVAELILSQEEQPGSHYSKREISDLTGISKSSVDRISSLDLNLQGFRKIKGQKLEAMDREKRVKRSKTLLRFFTKEKLSRTFFTDEKLFKLQSPLNTQNNRVYGEKGTKRSISDQRLYVERAAFPKSVMISAGVSMHGKTTIHFVEPGVRMNSDYYCNTVLSEILPQMHAMCPDFIFQQDGARCHTSKYTVAYLHEHVPKLVVPEHWPPHSPDLNVLDYCLWSFIETTIHDHQQVTDFELLKERIVLAWESIPQDIVNRAICAFPKRLRAVIKANGGHVEHFL